MWRALIYLIFIIRGIKQCLRLQLILKCLTIVTHKRGSFSDQRFTDALTSFEEFVGNDKTIDYAFNIEDIEICEATNVEEYFKMLEDSGWKRDEDILKPAWQIRAEKAGWTAPVKEV